MQQSELKKHWREFFDYQYIGSWSLEQDGNFVERVFTIKDARKEDVTNADGKKDTVLVLYFEEDEKGMVLNATNAKTIEGIYKTGILENWIGKRVQLYVKDVKAFGQTVPALRIRDRVPANKDEERIKELRLQVRMALTAYTGEDKEDIQLMLKEKDKAKEITFAFLSNVLEKLRSNA